MAALDYTVCLHSEAFVTTQGGNFPHFLIGHRRYLYEGHAKTIKPDKRKLALLFDNPKIRYCYFLSSYYGYHCSLAIFIIVLIKYNHSFCIHSWESFKHQLQDMLHHSDMKGIETRKPGNSLYTYPMPDCMCNKQGEVRNGNTTTGL